jgi:polyhydroxybutyrate depolymerase
LIASFHLDERRVHMTGFSQGGYMTWRFICQHADLLASAAPAATGGMANISLEVDCAFTGSDKPTRALDILYMHGTADALMAFGCEPPNGFTWGETVIEFFMAHPRR